MDPKNPNFSFLRHLFLIYDRSSIILNDPTPEHIFTELKSHKKLDLRKITSFLADEDFFYSPKANGQAKGIKPYKGLVSKIIKNNGKWYLFLLDVSNFNSLSVSLEGSFDSPCKSHVLDPKTGYAFVYDNRGGISVLVGNITGEWRNKFSDKERRICFLELFDKRQDPTLHLINTAKDSLLLLVVGGHENGNVFQDLQIFWLNFQRKINLKPVLRVLLRYARVQPLIYHMKTKEKNDRTVFILGGMNQKTIKKEGLIIKTELLSEANSSCETINLRKIEEKLFRNEIAGIEASESITMNQSYQISGTPKLLTKLDTFAEGAVLKLKAGVYSKAKTAFILGVGKSRCSIYQIEYVDEKGQQLHVVKKMQKALSSGFLCNSMFKAKDRKVFYLTDNNKEKYQLMDLKLFEGKNLAGGCHCHLF